MLPDIKEIDEQMKEDTNQFERYSNSQAAPKTQSQNEEMMKFMEFFPLINKILQNEKITPKSLNFSRDNEFAFQFTQQDSLLSIMKEHTVSQLAEFTLDKYRITSSSGT